MDPKRFVDSPRFASFVQVRSRYFFYYSAFAQLVVILFNPIDTYVLFIIDLLITDYKINCSSNEH